MNRDAGPIRPEVAPERATRPRRWRRRAPRARRASAFAARRHAHRPRDLHEVAARERGERVGAVRRARTGCRRRQTLPIAPTTTSRGGRRSGSGSRAVGRRDQVVDAAPRRSRRPSPRSMRVRSANRAARAASARGRRGARAPRRAPAAPRGRRGRSRRGAGSGMRRSSAVIRTSIAACHRRAVSDADRRPCLRGGPCGPRRRGRRRRRSELFGGTRALA